MVGIIRIVMNGNSIFEITAYSYFKLFKALIKSNYWFLYNFYFFNANMEHKIKALFM